MIKSLISFFLGFIGGIIFLMSMTGIGAPIPFAIIAVIVLLLISQLIARKIHISMKKKYHKRYSL